jgi:acyl carrier protein phosphodiesterase
MISDYVKGKKKFDYPEGIQKGIALHRAIDEFTDMHPATKEAKEVFRPHYRLYAGAFIDVVYDHFLANDKDEFDKESLALFSTGCYTAIDNYAIHLPEPFARMFPHMKTQDWLFNYREKWGMQKSFGGLVRRAAYITDADTAFVLFEQHYDLLQKCYNYFFKEVKAFAKKQLAG